jgi:hypothetical protein
VHEAIGEYLSVAERHLLESALLSVLTHVGDLFYTGGTRHPSQTLSSCAGLSLASSRQSCPCFRRGICLQ